VHTAYPVLAVSQKNVRSKMITLCKLCYMLYFKKLKN